MIDWQAILLEPAREVLTRAGGFLLTLLGVLVILLVGWFIAKALQMVSVKVAKLIRLDMLSEKAGLAAFLAKGEIKLTLSQLIGVIVYWLVMLIVFVTAVNALGLTVAAELLDGVVAFIPKVVASIFILILGIYFATLIGSFVRTAAANAGLAMATALGRFSQAIIIVFTVAVALGQLQIRTILPEITLSILIGALGLGAGLAFGLGCKDIAGKFVTDLVEKFKTKG